jgi:DnaK suppressor protein
VERDRQDFFKQLLLSWKEELQQNAESTIDNMASDEQKTTYPDPTDRALMESNRSFTLRIRDRERKLISKIDEALERLEDGTFGICENCGDTIGEKRLEARPVTTLCINCKKEAEEEEKKA